LLLELSLFQEDLFVWIIGDHSLLGLSPEEGSINVKDRVFAGIVSDLETLKLSSLDLIVTLGFVPLIDPWNLNQS